MYGMYNPIHINSYQFRIGKGLNFGRTCSKFQSWRVSPTLRIWIYSIVKNHGLCFGLFHFVFQKQWCGENLDPNWPSLNENGTEFTDLPWSAMKLVFLNVSNGDLYGLYGFYIYIAGWWYPLWKMMEFVSWDDFSIDWNHQPETIAFPMKDDQ